ATQERDASRLAIAGRHRGVTRGDVCLAVGSEEPAVTGEPVGCVIRDGVLRARGAGGDAGSELVLGETGRRTSGSIRREREHAHVFAIGSGRATSTCNRDAAHLFVQHTVVATTVRIMAT